MPINTKKYIESFIKIRNKNSEIVPLKLNQPQLKLYDVIRQLKQQGKPVRIIILKARQRSYGIFYLYWWSNIFTSSDT